MERPKIQLMLKLDAVGFIIPNDIVAASSFTGWRRKYMNEIGLLNGIGEVNDEDPIIHMWFKSDSVGCDNIAEHGFTVVNRLGVDELVMPSISMLPADLFYDCREDDNILIRVPHNMAGGDSVEIEMQVALKQQDNAYRNYGTFQKCFNLLIHRFTEVK